MGFSQEIPSWFQNGVADLSEVNLRVNLNVSPPLLNDKFANIIAFIRG